LVNDAKLLEKCSSLDLQRH